MRLLPISTDALVAKFSGWTSLDEMRASLLKPGNTYEPTVYCCRCARESIWTARLRQLFADTIDMVFISAGDSRRAYRVGSKRKTLFRYFGTPLYVRKNPRGGYALIWNTDYNSGWCPAYSHSTSIHPSLNGNLVAA